MVSAAKCDCHGARAGLGAAEVGQDRSESSKSEERSRTVGA